MNSVLSKVGHWLESIFNVQQQGVAESSASVASEDTIPATEDNRFPCPEGGYWWEKEIPDPPETVEFESFDGNELFASLSEQLKNDSISLLEMPDHIIKIVNLLESDDFDYAEIASNIEASPALYGEFMKISKSARFSRGIDVADLRQILPRLGRNTAKSILYMSTYRMSPPRNEFFRRITHEVVDHSMVVGRVAEYLSTRYYHDQSKAFLAGLLHDVGKIVILKDISETKNLPEIPDDTCSEALFREIFKDFHEKAGETLCKHWDLDSEATEAVAMHHQEARFVQEKQKLTALVNLSDTISRMLGFGLPIGSVDFFDTPAAMILGIDRSPETLSFFQDIMELFEEVDADAEASALSPA